VKTRADRERQVVSGRGVLFDGDGRRQISLVAKLAAHGKLADGEVAEEKGATRAQVALAWVLAQGPWIVPIPGTTKIARMEENAGAAEITLTPADLARIEGAMAQIEVKGDRYFPDSPLMKLIDPA